MAKKSARCWIATACAPRVITSPKMIWSSWPARLACWTCRPSACCKKAGCSRAACSWWTWSRAASSRTRNSSSRSPPRSPTPSGCAPTACVVTRSRASPYHWRLRAKAIWSAVACRRFRRCLTSAIESGGEPPHSKFRSVTFPSRSTLPSYPPSPARGRRCRSGFLPWRRGIPGATTRSSPCRGRQRRR